MIRAFFDSSVFFSACLSPSGASRALVDLCLLNELDIVVSTLVQQETHRNLAKKAPAAVPLFQRLIVNLPMRVVDPSHTDVIAAAAYTQLKDAPIVAAARLAQVDFLCSLDRRHLVDVPEVSVRSGLVIVLPETLLATLRADGRQDHDRSSGR